MGDRRSPLATTHPVLSLPDIQLHDYLNDERCEVATVRLHGSEACNPSTPRGVVAYDLRGFLLQYVAGMKWRRRQSMKIRMLSAVVPVLLLAIFGTLASA
jgi:hypothetical protein